MSDNKSKNTLLHGMVDIETMGTDPKAAIITIGACIIDPFGQDTEATIPDDRKFSATISFQDNQKHGRTFDADTIAWWLRQSKEAQQGLQEGDITNLKKALTEFNLFFSSQPSRVSRIWAKDPDFDCVIFQNAYKEAGHMWPFKFWESRSVRTSRKPLIITETNQTLELV